MKYQESNSGKKADFAEYVKKIVPELFGGRLVVEGKTVLLPAESDLSYKVKFDDDEAGGSLSIKVSWDNGRGGEEDVEVETE